MNTSNNVLNFDVKKVPEFIEFLELYYKKLSENFEILTPYFDKDLVSSNDAVSVEENLSENKKNIIKNEVEEFLTKLKLKIKQLKEAQNNIILYNESGVFPIVINVKKSIELSNNVIDNENISKPVPIESKVIKEALVKGKSHITKLSEDVSNDEIIESKKLQPKKESQFVNKDSKPKENNFVNDFSNIPNNNQHESNDLEDLYGSMGQINRSDKDLDLDYQFKTSSSLESPSKDEDNDKFKSISTVGAVSGGTGLTSGIIGGVKNTQNNKVSQVSADKSNQELNHEENKSNDNDYFNKDEDIFDLDLLYYGDDNNSDNFK